MKDFTEPDAPTPEGKFSGCTLGCLAVLLLPLLLLLAGYLVLFHSSVPVRWFAEKAAGSISSNGNRVDLNGVGGSLSSGVTLDQIVIYGDGEDSTIEGFTFRFNGLLDALRNKRLVIEELSTEGASIVVGADFFDPDNDADDADDEDDDRGDGDSGEGEGLALFELRELRFENTRIRTADHKTDLKIPLIRLAGLKIQGDDFELAEFEVDSNYLSLTLADAKPAEVEGHTMAYKRKVQGKLLPGIHPRVKAEIDFTVEFAALEGKTRARITAFGGALQQAELPGGTSLVRIDGLNLGDYFDTSDQVLPERFTMTAREADKVVTIEAGEFFLGETRFEIAGQEVDAGDPKSAVLGKAKVAGHTIKARIRPDKESIWPPFAVALEAEPKLARPELLARIYYQGTYDELEPEQRARVDKMARDDQE